MRSKDLLKERASHSEIPSATRPAQVRERGEEHVVSPYRTIPEAAEYLRVAPWTIAQAIRADDLKPAKMGKRFVLHVHDLDDYFRKQRDAA